MHQWLVPYVIQPLYQGLTGRRPWSEARRLRELQWRSTDELEARAVKRLRALVEHAATHVPYYRELLQATGVGPGDIRTLADLARVPMSEKTVIRANFPARVLADNLPARRRYRIFTSGSSGTPFELYIDRAELDSLLGSYYFFREWDGTALWDGRLRITGSSAASRFPAYLPHISSWMRRLVTGEWVVKVAGAELSLERFLELVTRLARRGPYTIDAYPSYAARLGAQLLEAGIELPACPRVVVCGAETLTSGDAAIIERAFRCRVLNQYSCWEAPHLAQTCPDNPAVLHVNSERAILRVVRSDGSTAEPGEQGRVLLTNLGNYVMPFINFDVGDLATAGSGCTCGRGFPTIQNLDGRTIEMIRTPAGKLISAGTLGNFATFQYPIMPYVWQFQAVQTAADALVLRIVPTERFTSEFAAALRERLRAFLGAGMRVEVEAVARIEPEASGKRLILKAWSPAA